MFDVVCHPHRCAYYVELLAVGGGCKGCGSVEHKQADCPEKRRQKSEGTIL